MNANRYFCWLARYNQWATQRLLSSMDKLPDEDYYRDLGLFFRSIHRTLNHLLVGEHLLWRERFMFGVSPPIALDTEVEQNRERLAQRLMENAQQWEPWLEQLSQQQLEGNLDYVSTRGAAQSLPFVATLSHVFNHSTHHRGQITAALTWLGYPCPELDMVYMLQDKTIARIYATSF